MMRQKFKNISILCIVLSAALFPAVLSAQTIVVLNGQYRLDNISGTVENSASDAKRVADRVQQVLEQQGATVIRQDESCGTINQSDAAEPLKTVALSNHADNALCVHAMQVAESYNFKLVSAIEVISSDRFLGPFSEALDVVSGMVEKALSHTGAYADIAEPAPESVEKSDAPLKPEDDIAVTQTTVIKPRRITPKTWVFIGVTGATALSAGIVEGIAYSKKINYEDKALRTSDEYNTLIAWQWASRGLLVASGVFAVTALSLTAVDLHKTKEFKRRRAMFLTPVLGDGNAALILQGSF